MQVHYSALNIKLEFKKTISILGILTNYGHQYNQ